MKKKIDSKKVSKTSNMISNNMGSLWCISSVYRRLGVLPAPVHAAVDIISAVAVTANITSEMINLSKESEEIKENAVVETA